jgi:hypothetical protein
LPREITKRLADEGYTFEDADAWLDLWCHTVRKDPRNIFSHLAPTVQFGHYGAVLTLETLGQRWGWEKTKVWRFLQKHQDAFALHKLPGSYGCLIFNKQYPTEQATSTPEQAEIIRILDEIRILGQNTHLSGTDNERINRMIALYSERVTGTYSPGEKTELPENRVNELPESRVAVLRPITRAYISLSQYKNCYYDCQGIGIGVLQRFQLCGSCRDP